VAIQRRAVGPAHEKIAVALTNLARCLIAQGGMAEAEALYRESLEMRQSIHGREHPRTVRSLSGLGSLLRQTGRLAEAEPLLTECLATRRKVFQAGHLDIAKALTEIALLREAQGNHAAAETALREAESIFAASPAAPSLHFDCRTYLARVIAAQDRCAEIESQLADLLAEADRTWPDAPARRMVVQGILAECHINARRFEEAEALLLQASASHPGLDSGDDEQQTDAGESRRTLQRLVMLYEEWDKADPDHGHGIKAAEWRAKLHAADPPRGAGPASRAASGPDTP
jgi:tetratricopeptide (TPR) repeat protein